MNGRKFSLAILGLSIFSGLLAVGFAYGREPERAAPATRTLDAITIEGAVDVPQVLFITSRENARFDDGLGWTFLPAADDILAPADLPVLIRPARFVKDSASTDHLVFNEPATPDVKE